MLIRGSTSESSTVWASSSIFEELHAIPLDRRNLSIPERAPTMFCQNDFGSMGLSLYWDIPFIYWNLQANSIDSRNEFRVTAMLIDALNSASSSSSHVEHFIRWKELSYGLSTCLLHL